MLPVWNQRDSSASSSRNCSDRSTGNSGRGEGSRISRNGTAGTGGSAVSVAPAASGVSVGENVAAAIGDAGVGTGPSGTTRSSSTACTDVDVVGRAGRDADKSFDISAAATSGAVEDVAVEVIGATPSAATSDELDNYISDICWNHKRRRAGRRVDLNPACSRGSLRTLRTSRSHGPLRSGRALRSGGTLGARRSGRSRQADRSLLPSCSGRALCSLRSGLPGRALLRHHAPVSRVLIRSLRTGTIGRYRYVG